MRKLSKKQKQLLEHEFNENDVVLIQDLSKGKQAKLESLNDYETLYQDASRYLNDLFFNNVYNPVPEATAEEEAIVDDILKG